MNHPVQGGKILIVDDCQTNAEILVELLRDQYDLATALNGEACLELVRSWGPDLVLLDIMMPGMDGYEICRRIKNSPVGPFTQVILISGKATTQERIQGYDAGADDYVIKPFDHDELQAKIRIQFRLRQSLMNLWQANARIQEFNISLEHLVEQRMEEIYATRDVAIFALAKLAESRDPETGEHINRMRHYSLILAQQLLRASPYAARIDEQFPQDLYRSSPLHDIGKVGIPDAILLKPGKLTWEEFEVMKTHTTIGANALREATRHGQCGSFLEMAIDVARHHHERFDGTGYPDGLSEEEIPLCARIVSLADVFDAMTTRRVYKAACDPEVATRIIEESSGAHFDPVIVDAFRAQHDEFLRIWSESDRGEDERLAAEQDLAFLVRG
ncbi:MAG: response regulator [Pirellulales bacterium]|nr:response regulator [Pirellulales bacterium]